MSTRVWSGAAVLASMTALFAEAVAAVALWGLVGSALEHPVAGTGPSAFDIMLLVSPVGAAVGLALTVLIVLPVLGLARRLRRRWVRHDGVGPAVAVVAVASAPVALICGLGAHFVAAAWGWACGGAALTVAVLAVRSALRRWGPRGTWRLFGNMLAVALSADAVLIGAGGVAYATGLVTAYAPPVVDARLLAGMYSDGRGGTLVLDASGGATAVRLGGADLDPLTGRPSKPCVGHGTWRLGEGGWDGDQGVEVVIPGCSKNWLVMGTRRHLELYYFVDDPDDGEIYMVSRRT